MGDIFSLQGLSHGGTKMFEKMIEDLKSKILEAVERYLKSHEKVPQKRLDLISKVELKEELGVKVEILCTIGLVSDYYNQIHRHNVNHYYLCQIKSFGETEMTPEEQEEFQLSTLKMTAEEAVSEYQKCASKPWGVLLANRELPVLEWAKEWLEGVK